MATLYITEFAALTPVPGGTYAQAPVAPGVAEQHLTISGNSTASAQFNDNTRFAMLHADAICSLAWSIGNVAATAVTTAQRMGAGETRFYGVYPGGTVSVIANT